MDIEFRWLAKRREVAASGDASTTLGYIESKTLQYRHRVMQMGNGYRQVGAGDGATYVAEYARPMGWTWSEWADVPTEIVKA